MNDIDSKDYCKVSEQYKKAAGKTAELSEMKAHQGKVKRQDTSYDIVSIYGDTFCISEEGRTVNFEKNDKLESVDVKDGIVIRKETVGKYGRFLREKGCFCR